MIDPKDAESVIDRVAARLARRYSWLEKDELVSEAWLECEKDDGPLARATNPGAFYRFLMDDLNALHDAERLWREERTAPEGVVDVANDGTVYKYDSEDKRVAYAKTSRDGTSDNAGRHLLGARSRLLDNRRSSTAVEFAAWADRQLGSAWGKKRDVQSLLFGSSAEQARLWTKYAAGKRVNGGKRLVIDGIATAEGEFQETLAEEWMSRYRWESNGPHPLVVGADGQTIEVARVLRQPIR